MDTLTTMNDENTEKPYKPPAESRNWMGMVKRNEKAQEKEDLTYE